MSAFNQFVSTIKRNGVARSSHFFCNILPPQCMIGVPVNTIDIVPFYIESVNMPEMSLATQSVKDTGVTREVVVDKYYGTCTMTFHCDSNMSIKMFFDEWLRASVKQKGGVFLYPESYTAEFMTVFHVDVAKNVTYLVNLNNVYPKLVDDIQLVSDSKSLISFRVQFVCESWDSYQINVNDPTAALVKDGRDNIRRAMGLVQLIRAGANRDGIKSALINVGTRKLYDILGKSGLDSRVAKSVDGILGKAGIGDALKSVEGIFL